MPLEHLLAQAREALRSGDLAAALPLFQSAAEAPDATAAQLIEFAQVLWADYRFDDALRAFEKAAHREPTDPTPLLLAAKRLFSLGRFSETADLLRAALKRTPKDTSTQRMLAEVLDRQGRRTEAENLAREAWTQNPADAQATRALAHILRAAGRVDEAADLLRRHLIDHPGPDNWRANYELAACLDRLGDYAGAISALLTAKDQLRPLAQPLLDQWHRRTQRREEFARKLDSATLRQWQQHAAQVAPTPPIAILAGHPRSGTTLLEQMLAAHPDVITTDETSILRTQFIEPIVLDAPSTDAAFNEVNQFDTASLEAGRAFYLRATQAHLGQPIGQRLLIEKDPLATWDLGFMLRLLPQSRVIFPLRDPRDICVSFFFTLLPLNADSAPALDLASTYAAVALTLRLWQHWREILPHPWVEIRYEQLVHEPRPELTRLTNTLNLPWHDAMLHFHQRSTDRGVRTPTYADVAQPLYTRSIARWKHYAPWLEPHLAILDPLLHEFGYADA